ncbi:MarR family transcriptional regulator [Lactobacillus sp. CBA3605]|uniref:MarR family winged helix-turn-helix transcriptional regulator n=1 Tax=Lactobacillus sp. CBA3605 TaxID=2099788 RepID=UPI000CFB3B76|nr:helix-turn-helix domain-containing protein [Lactobacillus sp. CBA3605]AVK61380.1 MarR family transcriptional regulator [Lactobacillus sp. CBA3605]
MNDDMEFFNRFSHMYLHGFKNLADMFAEPATEHGITLDEFYILYDIAEAKGKIRLMDIAETHGVTRSAISRLIGRLLRKDYLYQEAEDHDRRNKVLKLTPEGARVEHVVFSELLQRNREWSQTFNLAKQYQTLDLVEEFMDKFVNEDASKVVEKPKYTALKQA